MAIYMMRETQPITTAWIYHNSDLWLISLSSDGSNWITMADKNLGATQVWNSWDTLSEANCGKYYQWWNNYGFPFTWSVTTSSSRANVSNYWPWNYYSGSTFITSQPRVTAVNRNLRWWVTWTNEAMQWPCPSWFHISLRSEFTAVKDIWTALGWSSGWTNFRIALKLPFAWFRNYSATIYDKNGAGHYWYPERIDGSSYNMYYLNIQNAGIYLTERQNISCANSIRPFKNEAVQPDDSRTVLYQ